MKEEVALKTKAGLDIYISEGPEVVSYHHIPSYLESFYMGETIVISQLHEHLCPGQVFETSDSVFVNDDNVVKSYLKSQLYADAVDRIVSEVDKVQIISGFASLKGNQQLRLKRYLMEMLYNLQENPGLIRVPVLATYDYNNAELIPVEDIPAYVELDFGAKAILDYFSGISFNQTLCKSRFVYSYILKHLIGDN